MQMRFVCFENQSAEEFWDAYTVADSIGVMLKVVRDVPYPKIRQGSEDFAGIRR